MKILTLGSAIPPARKGSGDGTSRLSKIVREELYFFTSVYLWFAIRPRLDPEPKAKF